MYTEYLSDVRNTIIFLNTCLISVYHEILVIIRNKRSRVWTLKFFAAARFSSIVTVSRSDTNFVIFLWQMFMSCFELVYPGLGSFELQIRSQPLVPIAVGFSLCNRLVALSSFCESIVHPGINCIIFVLGSSTTSDLFF